VERDDEPDRHGLSSRARICINQYHDPPAAASSAPPDGQRSSPRVAFRVAPKPDISLETIALARVIGLDRLNLFLDEQ
jgi:hypothetical protein